MTTMTDTRARFLNGIAERLPADRVVEVHLFAPIKQGSTESGVAVLALDEDAADSRRLGVYTARYRLTLKGPDRGKWELNVQADADAPLLTIEKVIEGVQRRSGDVDGPEKLSGDEFRALLPPAEPADESAG